MCGCYLNEDSHEGLPENGDLSKNLKEVTHMSDNKEKMKGHAKLIELGKFFSTFM